MEKRRTNIMYKTVPVIASVLLLILMLNWWQAKAPNALLAQISAIASVALFIVLGTIFMGNWKKSWSNQSAKSGELMLLTGKKEQLKTFLKIAFMLIIVRLCVLEIAYILQLIAGRQSSTFLESIGVWAKADGVHYLDIARRWYVSDGNRSEVVQLVFLPMYPILVRAVNYIVGNYFASGIIVSHLSFILAGYLLYRLALLDMSHKDALRVVKYLCILPGAIFYSAPMTEGLFILLTVWCMYLARTKRYFFACVVGAVGAFTRSLGILMIVPVGFELITDVVASLKRGNISKKVMMAYAGRMLCLGIIPLGFAAYLYINYRVSGNPFQYMIYQKQNWSQGLGYFFNTASYQMKYAISSIKKGEIELLLGLWLPNIITFFASLLVMILGAKKVRTSYTAYFLCYFVISMGATYLLSAPRYMSVLFPLCFAMAHITKKRWVDRVVTIVCVVAFILYLYAFVCRWQVW